MTLTDKMGIMIIAMAILAVVLIFAWIHTVPLCHEATDALIVLGVRCENDQIHPILKDRLDTAIALAKEVKYKKIILTGGCVASSRPEAEIMRDYLLQHSIDAERIVLEQKAEDTIQNLCNCREMMEQMGLKSCTIVSNSCHLRRVQYIAHAIGLQANYYAKRDVQQLIREFWPTFHEVKTFRITHRLLKETIGAEKKTNG